MKTLILRDNHLCCKMMTPEEIAHTLVTNNEQPFRVHLVDEEITVPIEPCYGGSPETETVPCSSFEAVLGGAEIVDGGLNLLGIRGFHLPESEWTRVGLQKHWEHEDTDLGSPFFAPNRQLEISGSRESLFYKTDEIDYSFDHLSDIPDDSPIITEWSDGSPEEEPDKPPVPLERPGLFLYTLRAENCTDTHGFERIEVGQIESIEILDSISEQPTEPDIEPREVDFSPPPKYPNIDYDKLQPLPQEEEILEAVLTINRYAKQFDERADEEYQFDNGAEARFFSLRKKALYKTKTVAIHRLVKSNPDSVTVSKHDLNGEFECWCLYFPNEYSFHQPVDAVEDEAITSVCEQALSEFKVETIEFSPSSNTDDVGMTLDEALTLLANHGINANEHLDTKSVEDYNWGYLISTEFESLST